MEIRRGHVIAAFIGVLFAAVMRWHDPTLRETNAVPVVLWMMVAGGGFWEICLRTFRIWYPRLTGRDPSKR